MMQMRNLFLWQIRISLVLSFNRLFYRLQQIPGLGKHIPISWLEPSSGRKVIDGLKVIWQLIKTIIQKVIYYFGLMLISAVVLSFFYEDQSVISELKSPSFLMILVLFNLILGTLFKLTLMEPTAELDAMFIKLFRVLPNAYYKNKGILNALEYIIFDGIILSNFYIFQQFPGYHALFFLIGIAGMRLFIQLFSFKLYRLEKERANRIENWIYIIGTVLAFVTLFFVYSQDVLASLPLAFFFDGVFMLIGLVLGIFAFIAWDKYAEQINQVSYQMISLETVVSSEETIAEIKTSMVEIEEDSLEIDGYEIQRSKSASKRQNTGIAYMNQIFFERTGKMFRKKILLRALLIGVAFIGLAFLPRYFNIPLEDNRELYTAFLPTLSVITIYAAHLGEYLIKFCFFHMDRQLMKYGFYRNPQYVTEAVLVRFKYNVVLNVPILLVYWLGTILLYQVYPVEDFNLVLMNLALQLFAMVLFSFHYLIMYYTIQPFTAGMQEQSFVYGVMNGFIYILTFFAPQILADINPQIYPFVLIGITLIYIPLGLVLVRQLAPKNFKLK